MEMEIETSKTKVFVKRSIGYPTKLEPGRESREGEGWNKKKRQLTIGNTMPLVVLGFCT